MENKQKFENELNQFRLLKEQRDMYQGQLELINAYLRNRLNTKATLQNLKEGVNKNDDILVPIGGLVGIHASIQETAKVLLFIGTDTVIEKSVDDSIAFIDKLIEQHNEQLKYLTERIQQLDLNIERLSQSIQSSYSQREG